MKKNVNRKNRAGRSQTWKMKIGLTHAGCGKNKKQSCHSLQPRWFIHVSVTSGCALQSVSRCHLLPLLLRAGLMLRPCTRTTEMIQGQQHTVPLTMAAAVGLPLLAQAVQRVKLCPDSHKQIHMSPSQHLMHRHCRIRNMMQRCQMLR